VALTVSQIDAAIEAILNTGQSISADGVMYTRADLGRLQDLRRQIQAEEATSTHGSIFSRSLTGAMRR
jgi:hypothetical protein